MYNNILYPTDGSGGASAAIENARDLASQYDATVHILHVVNATYLGYETGSGTERTRSGMMGKKSDESRFGMLGGPSHVDRSGMMGGDPEELKREHKERADAIIAETIDHFEGVKTETSVRVGSPYHVILGYAATNDIDIIVMGTHGRTGLDRYLLGSVTEKIVRLSDVPVVTVRAADKRDSEVDAEAKAATETETEIETNDTTHSDRSHSE